MIEFLWNLWENNSQGSDIDIDSVRPKHPHVDITIYLLRYGAET